MLNDLFRIEGSEMKLVKKIEGGSCYDVLASQKHLVYIMVSIGVLEVSPGSSPK